MTEPDGAAGSVPGARDPGVRTPAFRRLWLSWAVSMLGDGARQLALPLYVAVQTRSPLAASAVTAAEVLPWLLCALPAGAIVDRSRPATVVTAAHAFRAVATAAVVLSIIYHLATTPVLCAFAFALTVAETFAYSATQSLMVALAGQGQLNEANAKFYTVHTVGLYLVGPLVAGALFVIGPAWAFALDGMTFVVAAILVAGLPPVAAPQHPAGTRRTRRLGPEIRDGILLLVRIRGLRVLVSMIAAATIAISAVNALTPLYAIKRLHMATGLVSTLIVVGALGALLGTRVAGRAARRYTEGQVMVASMATMAAGMVLFGAFPLVATAVVGNVTLGVGLGAWNVLAAARRQRLTPAAAMGRISGAYRMLAWGLQPIGAGIAGPLAVATSLGAVFVIVGGFLLLALAALSRALLSPDPAPAAAPHGSLNGMPVPMPTPAPPKPQPADPGHKEAQLRGRASGEPAG